MNLYAQVQDAYGGLLSQDQGSLPQTGADLMFFAVMGIIALAVGISIWVFTRP